MTVIFEAHGVKLELSGVDRRLFDRLKLQYEMPRPPVRQVEAWGGIIEDVPILDDPAYQKEMMGYNLQLARVQTDVVALGVKIVEAPDFSSEVRELRSFNIAVPESDVGQLFCVLPDGCVSEITERVLYLSTVTERGIDEAAHAYQVHWMGSPISAWHAPSSPASYGAEFEARLAAREYRMTWGAFCGLGGPEQSAVVCHYRMNNKLSWLQQEHEANRKAKR